MKKATYICFEGTEGVGKTTQTQKLVDYLRFKGYSVLQTKEPGVSHAPLTMLLRGVMLDKQYDSQMTVPARELISQAIRSIHMEKVVLPAAEHYDFIIQDRGILSGLSYGTACGNDIERLVGLSEFVTESSRSMFSDGLYDCIIYLKGNVAADLKRAQSAKQEFQAGDAMEALGETFIEKCSRNMDDFSKAFNTKTVSVDGKNIEEVFAEILQTLNLGE
jgi:dTMP kinase